MNEKVNHPQHYGGADNPYEVIKVLEHWLTRDEFVGFLKGNVQKYLARAKKKGVLPMEDYAKALWYNNYLVEFERRCPDDTDRITRVDAAFAANLRASMERNARMKVRLQKIQAQLGLNSDAFGDRARSVLFQTIETILKDEEPTWPPAA